MILEPDFPDHWKVEFLVRATGSETAVRCLLRFWAHCQSRRKWKFSDMTPQKLANICKWIGDEQVFFNAMIQTFLENNGNGSVDAHDWQISNSKLIACWKNGAKGGRPRSYNLKPTGSSGITQAKPSETHLSSLSSLSNKSTLKRRCTQKEAEEYCTSQGLTHEDGEWFFYKCEGCGWKNNGKPILDWKATIRAWTKISIFPSQKENRTYKRPKEEAPRGPAYNIFDPDGPPQ